VLLSVTVQGREPLEYQWYHEGTAIPGATNRELRLPHLLPADEGEYRVEVANALQRVLSPPARLTVRWERAFRLVSPTAVREGAELAVDLEMIAPEAVTGREVRLLFDREALGVPAVEWGPGVDASHSSSWIEPSGEVLDLTFRSLDAGIPPGTNRVATLRFQVAAVATNQAARLGFLPVNAAEPWWPAGTGWVTLVARTEIRRRHWVGDNNGNDRLDVGDVRAILDLARGPRPLSPWMVVGNDLDASGAVDAADAVKAVQLVAGLGLPSVLEPGAIEVDPRAEATLSTSPLRLELAVIPGVPRVLRADVLTQTPHPTLGGLSFVLRYPLEALAPPGPTQVSLGVAVPENAVTAWTAEPARQAGAQDAVVRWAAGAADEWQILGSAGTSPRPLVASFQFALLDGALDRASWSLSLEKVEIAQDRVHLITGPAVEATFETRAPREPRFAQVLRESGGGWSTVLVGEPDGRYRIEATTDWVTWAAEAELTLGADGTGRLVRDVDPALPARFVRAVQIR